MSGLRAAQMFRLSLPTILVLLGNGFVSAPVFSQSLPDPDSQTAAFIESNVPGALGLLNTYQLALNECDAVLFEQVVNDDAWIVGFPTDSARQLGALSEETRH